jgi:hypothetical protein
MSAFAVGAACFIVPFMVGVRLVQNAYRNEGSRRTKFGVAAVFSFLFGPPLLIWVAAAAGSFG